MKKKYFEQDNEEFLNFVSHGIALIVSFIGLFFLIEKFYLSKKNMSLFAAVIYGISLVLLYAASTFYHLVKDKKTKHLLRIIDHSSIFIFIAGSYSPILLLNISGKIGWYLFGAQWTLAIIGIIFKIFYTGKYEIFFMVLYLVMGWMIILKWELLVSSVPIPGLNLIILGGLAYSTGVIFYLLDTKYKYFHFIWHIFVIIGSSFHYFTMLIYLA